MSDYKEFVVTEDHLKLLDRTYISYDRWTEFGVPCVDPKRPYGNSSVYQDIAEILGEEVEDEWEGPTGAQRQRYDELHQGMQHVLQILVRNRSIQVGAYRTSNSYGIDWAPYALKS